MDQETETLGAYEVKVHFSEVLERAAQGIPYVVTRRGKPWVRIIPAENENPAFRELAAKAREARSRIAAKTGTLDVKALINEGRSR